MNMENIHHAVYESVSTDARNSVRYFTIPAGFEIYHMKNKMHDVGAFGHSGFYFCHVDPRDFDDLVHYRFRRPVRFPRLYDINNSGKRTCKVSEFITAIDCELSDPKYDKRAHGAPGVTQAVFSGRLFAACSGAKCQTFFDTSVQYGSYNAVETSKRLGGWMGCDVKGRLEFFMYETFAKDVLDVICTRHSLQDCRKCPNNLQL